MLNGITLKAYGNSLYSCIPVKSGKGYRACIMANGSYVLTEKHVYKTAFDVIANFKAKWTRFFVA